MSALANLITFAEKEFSHVDPAKVNEIKSIGLQLYNVASSLADSRHRNEALTSIETGVFHILQGLGAAAPTKK